LLALNPSNEDWKPRLNRLGILQNPPIAGQWITLVSRLDELKLACNGGEHMPPDRQADWIGGTGITGPCENRPLHHTNTTRHSLL
jgi:hypothetical protein